MEGSYYGLKILSKVNEQWIVKNNITGFDISSRFFEISNNGKIIVSHGYKGVYKLSVNSDFTNIIDYELDSIALKEEILALLSLIITFIIIMIKEC